MNILISACLLGLYCRYDGTIKQYENVKEMLACPEIHIIPICPEQAGGLATPRAAAERQGQRVVTQTGVDVTKQYRQGAATACELAKKFHCSYAVLKEKSPSCGSQRIYDGTFTRTLIRGDGVTAAALKQIGVTIIGESQILDFLKTIKRNEKR